MLYITYLYIFLIKTFIIDLRFNMSLNKNNNNHWYKFFFANNNILKFLNYLTPEQSIIFIANNIIV